MNIPSRVNPFGYDNTVPPGYMRAEFLESTGTQWVRLGLRVQNLNTKIRYYSIYGPTAGNGGGVFECVNTTSGEIYQHGTYKGGSGDWAYFAITRIKDVTTKAIVYKYQNKEDTTEINLQEAYVKVGTRVKTLSDTSYQYPDNEPVLFAENTVSGNAAVGHMQHYTQIKLYEFEADYAGVPASRLVPSLDSSGVPCLYDTVRKTPFYNRGTGAFTVGFDTTEKAAISISKLPITTDGTLTVSLPAEAEDTATWVPAAIEIATNRGWTIITQYRED